MLRENYVKPDVMSRDIAAMVGKSLSSVHTRAAKLGLRAPAEKARISGRMSCNHPNTVATRFRKGHVPASKGKKMSARQYALCAPTMFKPGQRPPKWRPVGSERVNVDGYIEVKVSDKPPKWGLKHRIVWQQVYGPIPPGCNVQFRNHITTDCRPENLYLITRRDQFMKENSIYAQYPPELQYLIKLKGTLNRQIHKAEKRNAEQ